MKFLDPGVVRDLEAGVPLKIDLGSGGPGRHGSYGVDMRELPGVAIQADLNGLLTDLPDNSVGSLVTYHCLEHVAEFLQLMREIHRIVRPGGSIDIVVPHFSNPYGYSDPTHVRFFGLYSFYYFVPAEHQPKRKVPSFYSDTRFDVKRIQINLQPRSLWTRLRHPRLGTRVANSFHAQDWWERRLCWQVPADEIRFLLSPVK
jgi:SAM-dependent methyltransferase